MKKLVAAAILLVVLGGVYAYFFGFTESFQRKLKNVESNILGGLSRTCTAYALDGSVMRVYKGKFDIQAKNEGLVMDIKGKRHTLYNTTVLCSED